MPRPAPAVDRAFTLLNYMSKHPRESFTLSEIAKSLDFNKATCHAMCNAMSEHGVLIRNPVDKTYSLGPALLRFAAAVAPEKREALEIARAEMGILAKEFQVTVAASALVGDRTTVLATRVAKSSLGPDLVVGSQTAWVPPIGPTFAAWAPPDVTSSWLSNVDAGFAREYFEGVLTELRKRGYDVGFGSDPRTQLLQTLRQLGEITDSEHVGEVLAEIMKSLEEPSAGGRGKARQPVNNVTAPVFGAQGDVVLTLTLHGFARPLSAHDVSKIGKRLLSSAEGVTRALHGVLPDDWPRRR